MLHLLCTVGNVLLCYVLLFRWRQWKWIAFAQAVSMALLLWHNVELYAYPEEFRRWQQGFDIANMLVEVLYLIDLKKSLPFTFSVFAGIGLFTCFEYATFEAGHREMANQLWYVRVWADCFAMYLLSGVIIRQEVPHELRRTGQAQAAPTEAS